MRDSRCSSLASLTARASLASISSEICTACALICPAWRRTTTISSSRDISSRSGTGRSNRTQLITLGQTRRVTTGTGTVRHAHPQVTAGLNVYPGLSAGKTRSAERNEIISSSE